MTLLDLPLFMAIQMEVRLQEITRPRCFSTSVATSVASVASKPGHLVTWSPGHLVTVS